MTPYAAYLALGSLNPATGAFVELVGGSYARQPISLAPDGQLALRNDADVVFATATSDWPDFTAYALFDAIAAGSIVMWWDEFGATAPREVRTGRTYRVRAGRISLTFPQGVSHLGTPIFLNAVAMVSPLGLSLGGSGGGGSASPAAIVSALNGALNVPQAIAASGAAQTLTCGGSAPDPVYNATLTANTAFTLAGSPTGRMQAIYLLLTQDGTGGRVPSFSPNVAWPGGAIPQVSAAAGSKTLLQFITLDGGATFIGGLIGANLVTPSLSIVALSSLVSSAATTVNGAYGGNTPVNFDVSVDGGAFTTLDVTNNAVAISNGAWSFSITNPAVAGAHTLQVRETGTAIVSAAFNFTTTAAPAAGAPTAVAATPTNGNNVVNLALTATANGAAVTSFNIRRGTTPGGEAATPIGVATPASSPTSGVTTAAYADTTAANGNTYYYTAEAVSTAGNTLSAEVTGAPASGSWIPAGMLASVLEAVDFTDPTSARDAGLAAGGSANNLIDRVTDVVDNTRYYGQPTAANQPAIVTTGGANGATRVGRFAPGTSFLSSLLGSAGVLNDLYKTSNPTTETRYTLWVGRFNPTGAVSRPFGGFVSNTTGVGHSFRQTTSNIGFSQQSPGGGSLPCEMVTPVFDTVDHVWEEIISGGQMSVFKDGVKVSPTTNPSLSDTTALSPTSSFLGGAFASNSTTQVGVFGGDTILKLTANAVPSAADRATLRANAAAKAGGIATA